MNTADSGNESYDQGLGLGLKTTNVQQGRSMEEAAALWWVPRLSHCCLIDMQWQWLGKGEQEQWLDPSSRCLRNLFEFPKGEGNLFVGNRFRWLMVFKSLLNTRADIQYYNLPSSALLVANWIGRGWGRSWWINLGATNILFSYSKTLTPNIHLLCCWQRMFHFKRNPSWISVSVPNILLCQ